MKAVEVQFTSMTSQSVKSLSMFALCSLLPNNIVSHPMPVLADSVAVKLLNMANCSVSSFSCIDNIVELLPPLREYVFPAESLEQLEKIYSQLYTGFDISFLSPFYLRSNRIRLAGDLIGSDNNAASATASSVIMAYWPGRGDDLTVIDNSSMLNWLICTITCLFWEASGSPMWCTFVSGDTTSIRSHFTCTHIQVSVSSALLLYFGSGLGLVLFFTYQHVSIRSPLCPPATYIVWFCSKYLCM